MELDDRRGFEWSIGRMIEGYGFVPVRRGWPDYAVFRRDGTLRMLIEVKTRRDRMTFAQHLIHDALRAAGIEVRVVRDEEIPALEKELAAEEAQDRLARGVTPRTPAKAEAAYCTDPTCAHVLRHEWHKHWKPRPSRVTPEQVAAAAMRRAAMFHHGKP